jgi:hypothetical protein
MTIYRSLTTAAAALLLTCFVQISFALSPTGNPAVDQGWEFGGNSLANGTYVRGEATFSFDIYSASFAVETGSNLEIADGQFSWLPGDQILGLGGVFVNTDATTAGWPAFTPNPYIPANGDGLVVNDDISSSSRPVGKFGTSTSNFTVSTTAPFLNGDGNGSLDAGHGGDGAILMRITQNRGSSTDDVITNLDRIDRYDAAGVLILSTSSSAVVEDDNLLKVGRMIYKWNGSNISSWQYLLNTSLLEREFPYGAYPEAGNQAIMAVQRGDNRFTDGLINTIPEPSSFLLLALSSSAFVVRRRR